MSNKVEVLIRKNGNEYIIDTELIYMRKTTNNEIINDIIDMLKEIRDTNK